MRITNTFKRRGWLMARQRTRLPAFGLETLKRLLGQVTKTQNTEYACNEAYRFMDQFAEMVACGKDAAGMMPLVQKHLELCPDCREEFEALLRAIGAMPEAIQPDSRRGEESAEVGHGS